jgi:hypothetical protein
LNLNISYMLSWFFQYHMGRQSDFLNKFQLAAAGRSRGLSFPEVVSDAS